MKLHMDVCCRSNGEALGKIECWLDQPKVKVTKTVIESK